MTTPFPLSAVPFNRSTCQPVNRQLEFPSMTAPLWRPTPEQIARAQMTRFIADARALGGAAEEVHDYESLWRWSLAEPERFWALMWRFGGVIAEPRAGSEPWDRVLVGGERMA